MRGVTEGQRPAGLPFMISTHTPHAGRDIFLDMEDADGFKFQLTRPMRGVTLIGNYRSS